MSTPMSFHASTGAERKVLFLTYLYPPIANSGTRRSLEFANRLPALGWIPLVVAGVPDPDEYDAALLREVRPGTAVTRVPLGADEWACRIGRWLRSQRVAAGLAWRIRALWALPDSCSSWRAGAVEAALDLFHTQGFDLVYASGWPWSSFLVAEEVSRRTGRPFVIDYRDLWVGSGAEFDRPQGIRRLFPIDERLERRVLTRADAVVTTTETFAGMLSARGGGRKVYSITNGFAQADFAGFGAAAELTPGRPVKISYTGIWRHGYGPGDLYGAVALLKRRKPDLSHHLRVTMAGFPPGRAGEQGIDDVVAELGRVTHGAALEIMKTSDALYLPVSGGLYDRAHLPGKIFEYVGSGRRILASAEEGSEVRRVLAAVGGYVAVTPGDVEGLAAAILGLIERRESEAFRPRIPEAIARFERQGQATQLSEVFESVLARHGE